MKYIITYYPVSDQVYNQLHLELSTKYCKQLIQPALHFLGYLINSVEVNIRKDIDPIIPIPYTDLYTILKVSRGATEPLWSGLLELDYIKVLPEQDNICRRYLITDKLISILYPNILSISKIRYNLCTGKRIIKLEKSQKYDSNKHKLNSLITDFFDNVSAIDITSDTLQLGWNMFEDNKHKQLSVRSCIKSIINRSIIIDTNNLQYKPTYKMQSTGRISEIGGGGQSCSNNFKTLLFKDYYNYDLKSSQLNIFRWYLERANIEHDWLIKYVTNSAFKESIILQSTLSITTFKQCLLALLMGSNFSKNSKVIEYIYKDKPDISFIELVQIKTLFLPLIRIISKWNSHLLTSFIKDNLISNKKGKCIRNKIDIPFYLDDYWNINTGKWKPSITRYLTAHLLQGFESYYILTLSSILFQLNIQIVSQQHDGIITRQLIPATVIKQTKDITGYIYGDLVIKSFV